MLKVSQFVNDNGGVLDFELYKEAFFKGSSNPTEPFADALIPFESGSSFDVVLDENEMFYVDLRSSKTQSSSDGLYNGTVGLYHSNGTLMEEKVVSVKVWDFDLPDKRYSDVVMGLYNSVSGYNSIKSCLTLNGVKYATENGTWDVATESLPLAKEILARHQEVLLDHGINTYELPRWLIMDDPHAAMLAAMDPRRKFFVVPITSSDISENGTVRESAQELYQRFKDMVSAHEEDLAPKAFFYQYDEPGNWSALQLDKVAERMERVWPGYHMVIPFYSEINEAIRYLKGRADIFCPNQATLHSNDTCTRLIENTDGWYRIWRYPGDGAEGSPYHSVHFSVSRYDIFESWLTPCGTYDPIVR